MDVGLESFKIILVTAVAVLLCLLLRIYRCVCFELLLLEHGLSNNDLLKPVLAENYVFQSACICSFRLHQLYEAIGHLVPLPVDHHVQDGGQRDGLRSKEDTLVDMEADIAV